MNLSHDLLYSFIQIIYFEKLRIIYNFFFILSSLEKALEIQQKILPLNHHNVTTSYNNMRRNIFNKIGNYSKALSFHEKAHEIYTHLRYII